MLSLKRMKKYGHACLGQISIIFNETNNIRYTLYSTIELYYFQRTRFLKFCLTILQGRKSNLAKMHTANSKFTGLPFNEISIYRA